MRTDIRGCYKRYLKCPVCGKVCEMWAKKRKIRPEGHIKTMTCYFCGKEVDMCEVRESGYKGTDTGDSGDR